MTDLSDIQVALEASMAEYGVTRYRQNLAKARDKQREAQTPAGRYLMRESLAPVSGALACWVDQAADKPGVHHLALPLVELMGPSVLALIALKSIVDSIVTQRTRTQAALAIASLALRERRYQ